MSKIEQLINKLCPNGVAFKKIGSLIDYIQPGNYIVTNTKYDGNHETPVLTAGKSFLLGYTDEDFGIYPASKLNPVVIFDDFTTSSHWVDFPFKVKSSALKILVQKESESNFRFLFYIMKSLNYTPGEGTHERHWISKYAELNIPVPPLEVQNEIVRILDNFTDLEAELEAELEARKKQYEYYRNKMLTFDKHEGEVEYKMLKDLAIYENGKGHESNVDDDGTFILINSKFISMSGKVYKHVTHQYTPAFKNDITMVLSDLPNGKALAKCYFVEQDNKYTVNQRICRLSVKLDTITPKYLYYALDRNQQLLKYDNGVDQTNLSKDNVLNISIPVPSLEKQNYIVDSLDKLNLLTTSLQKGLPAEIEARHQQYEYYRNKLLTFKEEVNV